ncbi:MAG: DUF484 family protein [Pseudomonadota bacterium]
MREFVVSNPDFVLNDPEMMRALLHPGSSSTRNVIDLRGALIDRLERRLGKLAEAHRDVIAAAWDNMTGMDQIHRAALALLDAQTAERFSEIVTVEFSEQLDVDYVRLCLHEDGTEVMADATFLHLEHEDLIALLERIAMPGAPQRVLLRGHLGESEGDTADPVVFGDDTAHIRSDAMIRLDFGRRHLPGLLAFGSRDPDRFHEEQGTDLLSFLGAVTERMLREWLYRGT